MIIKKVTPRADFNSFLAKEVGYHVSAETGDNEYIDSEHVIEISEDQADFLDDVTVEIYGMCLQAVDKVISEERFAEFGIGELQAAHIRKSWNRSTLPDGTARDPELYGRIDYRWNGSTERDQIKFFEFNADTPATSYECSTVQWMVVKDLIERGELPAGMQQFNLLEEKLIERFAHLKTLAAARPTGAGTLYFSALTDFPEDMTTTAYLQELAQKAGWDTLFEDIGLIGANDDERSPDYGALFDTGGNKIRNLYKLMPWEHLFEADYAKYLARDEILFFEPPWRAILSNKMLSVILWEMFPDHPYLLPTFTTPESFNGTYVEKPIFGRIGAGIKIVFNDEVVAGKAFDPEQDMSTYEQYPKVYQEYCPLPTPEELPGWRLQTGVWVVGNGDVAGMDIRRDTSLVNGSPAIKFVPHVMRPRS